MIGKITTGSNFVSLFKYLLRDNKQARIISGDRLLLEPNAQKLASQFNWIASTRPTTKKPVKHISIGFAPTDGEIDNSITIPSPNEKLNFAIPSPKQIHKNWPLVKRAFIGQLELLLIQYPQSPCLKFYHCCTACLLTSARQPWVNWVSSLLLC